MLNGLGVSGTWKPTPRFREKESHEVAGAIPRYLRERGAVAGAAVGGAICSKVH